MAKCGFTDECTVYWDDWPGYYRPWQLQCVSENKDVKLDVLHIKDV